MADYTPIDPNTLLPGEPWTSAKALAAFENPEAITEGAVGAPRNRGTSHFSPGLGSNRQRNCLPYGNVVAQTNEPYPAIRHYLGEMTALVNCSVRIVYSAAVSITGTAPTAAVTIYKNGVSIGGISGTATATNTVIDVSLVAGDCIGAVVEAVGQLGGSAGNGGTATLSRLEYLVDVTTAGLI